MWECGKRRYRFPYFHIENRERIEFNRYSLLFVFEPQDTDSEVRKRWQQSNRRALFSHKGGTSSTSFRIGRTWLLDNTPLVCLMVMVKRPHAHNELSRHGDNGFLGTAGIVYHTPILVQKHRIFVVGTPGAFDEPSPNRRISLFGDPPAAFSIARRTFAAGKPDVRGHTFPVTKPVQVAPLQCQSGCRFPPDSRYRLLRLYSKLVSFFCALIFFFTCSRVLLIWRSSRSSRSGT